MLKLLRNLKNRYVIWRKQIHVIVDGPNVIDSRANIKEFVENILTVEDTMIKVLLLDCSECHVKSSAGVDELIKIICEQHHITLILCNASARLKFYSQHAFIRRIHNKNTELRFIEIEKIHNDSFE